MGVWHEAGQLAETFVGPEGARRWLERSPKGVTFRLDGAIVREGRFVFRVRYRYAAGDFDHGGKWLFELDREDRIGWLMHDPDPLDPDTGLDADWSGAIEQALVEVASQASRHRAAFEPIGDPDEGRYEVRAPDALELLTAAVGCLASAL